MRTALLLTPELMRGQVLPGSEEELKCKARMEEEQRQRELRKRQQMELQELCELFAAIEAGTIETVYDSCDYNRTQTLNKLLEMSEGSTDEAQGEIANVLASEVDRIESMISYKKNLVDASIRCPISGKPMVDPVFAADGCDIPPNVDMDPIKLQCAATHTISGLCRSIVTLMCHSAPSMSMSLCHTSTLSFLTLPSCTPQGP